MMGKRNNCKHTDTTVIVTETGNLCWTCYGIAVQEHEFYESFPYTKPKWTDDTERKRYDNQKLPELKDEYKDQSGESTLYTDKGNREVGDEEEVVVLVEDN